MAQEHPITRLGGWAGYEVVEDWQERRGGKSWCVLRLEAVAGYASAATVASRPGRFAISKSGAFVSCRSSSTGWSWSCRGCAWPARAVGRGWSG